MEQAKTNKIIISVKVGTIQPEKFSNYQAYGSIECFEVYKLLLKKSNTVYANFTSYLKQLKYTNTRQQEKLIFENCDSFNYSIVFNNANFKNWINKIEHKMEFISQLIGTEDVCLIRKHKEEEIYVVPVLNDDYNDENVKYTEMLIAALKQEGDDLWLLLHDKDLYGIEKKYHRADLKEFNIINCIELKALIVNNRVFTFIHQDSDHFYSEVIKKLDELTLDGIIKELEVHKRVEFAKDVAKNIRKEDMVKALGNASETYDFSKDFLEL